MSENGNKKHKLLMVGLPETGKSTYLAAFWDSIEGGSIPRGLKLGSILPSEREYLNKIRDEWLSFEVLTRNISTDINEAYFDVSDDSGNTFSLFFPDVSGETYREIFEGRSWEKDFGSILEGATELLIFLHTERCNNCPTINEIERIVVQIRVEGDEGQDTNAPEEKSIEWSPEFVSEEVKIVDLIQLLTSNEANTNITRIGIIVSAWDLMSEIYNAPDDFVETVTPMLHQYLCANSNNWTYRIFGVSAQGGDYDKPSDLDALTKLSDLNKRSKIFGITNEEADQNDVTFPVKWLLM